MPNNYNLQSGQVLDKYELDRILGTGQSEMWLARDVALDRRVALKIVPGDQRDLVERLFEARVGAKVVHENLCPVLAAEIIDDPQKQPCVLIAFELLTDGDITQYLRTDRRMDTVKVQQALLDTLSGLDTLHTYGILHNDIKPANILRKGESFLLGDYGISHINGDRTPQNCYWMHVAPETAVTFTNGRVTHQPTVATDVYQMGVTAFRLVNGIECVRDQFSALTLEEFVKKAETGELLSKVPYHWTVPRRLRQIINLAISPDTSKRYPSALSFRRAVEKLDTVTYWHLQGLDFHLLKDGKIYRIVTQTISGKDYAVIQKQYKTGDWRYIHASRMQILRPGLKEKCFQTLSDRLFAGQII